MNKIYKWVLVLLVLLPCIGYASSEENILDRKVENIHYEKVRLLSVIMSLSGRNKVPIGCEVIFDEKGRLPELDLVVNDLTLRQVLDKIVELLPEYAWEFDSETGFINIFPKNNSPFDFYIDKIEKKNKTFDEIMFSETEENLWSYFEDRNIKLYIKAFFGIAQDKTLIDVNIKNKKARKVLNQVLSKVESGHYVWSVVPSQGAQGPVQYLFAVTKLHW